MLYNRHWSPLVVKPPEQLCIKTDSNSLNAMLHQQCNTNCAESITPSKHFNYTDIDYTKYICPFGSIICHPKAYDCVHDKDFFGKILMCKEAWQFQRCKYHSRCLNYFCKDKYFCKYQSWCIPYRLVCNGEADCPLGDDEWNCTSFVCRGMLRCTKERICVHPSEVCDGVLHCPLSGDDEAVCSRKCPEHCMCLGRAILCINPTYLEHNTSAIVMIRLKPEILIGSVHLENAWFVDISYSYLSNVENIRRIIAPSLIKLNLSNNPLNTFSSRLLQFRKLRYLYMEETKLGRISEESFFNFPMLTSLSLKIHTYKKLIFVHFALCIVEGKLI